jgi:hypothetical protein
MTDQELQRLERDTLDELGGVMYRAALLHTGMLKQGDQQLMYEQLFGAVASLCMSGHCPRARSPRFRGGDRINCFGRDAQTVKNRARKR